MRLYLSSFRLGTDPQHLVRLAGRGARVAVVANAVDGDPVDVRRDKVAGEVRALAALGLRATELDLREHAGASTAQMTQLLSGFDGLWVRGGNAFVLRAAMAVSAADRAVIALLADDGLVYAGYSAGPCVLAPSLAGLETVDDADAPRRLGLGEARMDGLGVLARRVVPHVASPTHPESVALDALAKRYTREGVPHLRLTDGQALVVDGDTEAMVGRPATVAELMAVYPG
jgi:dipeptidase E